MVKPALLRAVRIGYSTVRSLKNKIIEVQSHWLRKVATTTCRYNAIGAALNRCTKRQKSNILGASGAW